MTSHSGPYLPDLGRCIAGDTLILSWDDILKSLLSHDPRPMTSRTHFFADPTVKSLLANPNPSFPPPSSQAKSIFESKIAAVNIPPLPSKPYDIEEIKSDALWLSSQVQIDELEALRLTLLEWQYQPETRLKYGFSDAELASLRDGLGVEYVEGVGLVPGSLLNRSDADFDTSEARHVRLLQLYFSERVRLLSTASVILEQSLLSSSHSEAWTPILKNLPSEPTSTLLDEVSIAVQAVKDRMQDLNSDRSWLVSEKHHVQLTEDYTTSTLQAIAIVLEVLLLRIRHVEEHVYSEPLLTWLQFMELIDYFTSFQSDVPIQRKAIDRIQCTTSCITVALLDPSSTFAFLGQDTTLESMSLPPPDQRDWFIDKESISHVHQYLLAAAESFNAQAGLGVLVWSLVLLEMRTLATGAKEAREARHVHKGIERSPHDVFGKRLSSSSAGSIQSTIYEDILGEVMAGSTIEDPVDYMLNCATQGSNVFDQFSRICALSKDDTSIFASVQIHLLQEWVRAIRPRLGYSPELVSAQLVLLSQPPSAGSDTAFNVVTNFVADDVLRQDFLDVAASRFPYESLPFLRMCRALAKCPTSDIDGTVYITFRLQELLTFTQEAVAGFAYYNTFREDENANLVQLDCAVSMLDFQSNKSLTFGTDTLYLNLIPSQTIGEVIRETTPSVVKWQHSYSGLSLLGKWLEMHLKGVLSDALSPFEAPEDVAAETMGLLATLLETTYTKAKKTYDEKRARLLCQTILQDFASTLDSDRTIISCISDLMEQQLQSATRSNYEILIACIDFFTIYCKIEPQAAWSSLIRSSAFGAKGTRRNLPALIAGIEVPAQSFGLLESCSRLYDVVVDTMLVVAYESEDQNHGPASSKRVRQTASQRFNGAALLAYTETMYAAFESMSVWIFGNKSQKDRVTTNFALAFSKLISYVFGTGEAFDTVTPLSAPLKPAATFALQMLQQVDATSTGTGPLTPLMVSAVIEQDPKDAFASPNAGYLRSVLSLCRILDQCNQFSSSESIASVNARLINLIPVIARLPFVDHSLWADSSALLSNLLQGSSPSLLGHLGSASCVSFIDSLKHASQAADDPQLERQKWQLLSRLVTVDQQWFAIVLITGSAPGRDQKDRHINTLQTQGKPVLEMALDLLADVSSLDPSVPSELISFVGEAQQNWLSVTHSIASRTDLFSHLIQWVSSKDSYTMGELDKALHNEAAAGVTDLMVIHLHRVTLKTEPLSTTLIPLLHWLATNAVKVASYNSSLHANLKKNFAMKYRGLDITSIKRSGLVDASYGNGYFYDETFADKFLSSDPHWKGGKSQQTFFNELQRASLNLSVVDSELTLLRSLERFCVEHGKFFARNGDIARVMARTARHCLTANMQVTPTEALFDSLFQTRADIAVVLVRPLAAMGYRGSDYSALLTTSWDVARFRNGSYEMAITNNDLTSWRSIMSVLLMSMQFRVERKLKQANVGDNKSLEQIDPYNAMFCEIAAKIVGEGLRSVVMALQEQQFQDTSKSTLSTLVGHRDVALLLNILQTILRLASLPQFAVQLGEALISTGAGRSALLLYTWSHTLLEEGTPVYASLAVSFVASISSLPRVAEDLAVEGVLNRLLTARMTQTLQCAPSGMSHLDKRPNGPLLYSIWAQGMLPLCLNLLHAIGGGVAEEVSSFLNVFPNQLNRATLALSSNPAYASEGAGTLTTKVVSEISTLALVSFILSSLRDAGASAGVDPTAIEALGGFDEHKGALAEDMRDVVGQQYLYRKRRTLVDGERERALQLRLKGGKNKDDKEVVVSDALDGKIVKDLNGALKCLLGGDDAVVIGEGEKDD